MRGVGEKNSRSVVSDATALHIKAIRKIQMPDKKIGEVIKYIQNFYNLPYHTIYSIIYNRYKHLDDNFK